MLCVLVAGGVTLWGLSQGTGEAEGPPSAIRNEALGGWENQERASLPAPGSESR